MQEAEINVLKTNSQLAEAFALFLVYLIKMQPRVNIALSGGSTPKRLFKHLAKRYKKKVNWSKVHFFWGDERCVPPDHPESNFGVTKSLLLQHLDIPVENIHRIKGEAEDPKSEARRYASVIKKTVPIVDGLPAFDLILLGMGDDGHTASIFPDSMGLLKNKGVCKVARHPKSGQQRITLTGTVINNAQNVAFLVAGAGKSTRVREILLKEPGSDAFPAAHIHPSRGELFWFLDERSSKKLTRPSLVSI